MFGNSILARLATRQSAHRFANVQRCMRFEAALAWKLTP